MSFFQIVVTGAFAVLIVVGVGVFSIFGGVGGGSGTGAVVVWGTTDDAVMQGILGALKDKDGSLAQVTYTQIPADTYLTTLVNAMAAGQGPDLFFVSQSNMGVLQDKLVPISYDAVSQSTYLSSYIDEGRLFLTGQGYLALPFMVDPLVMYWNRDLFTSAGIAQPPRYWSDLITMAPKLTTLDAGRGVSRSAVAMGAWSNIANAKAILSALFMQSGDFITNRDSTGALKATFGDNSQAADALRFYASFANPGQSVYSWNRSLPLSTNEFLAGDLAVYLGFASEASTLATRNPNLHFAIATLPQLSGGSSNITYGNLTGLAVSRGSRNPQGAIIAAQALSGVQAATILVGQTGLPPVRRDIPLNTAGNSTLETFAQSALWSRGWADPNNTTTNGTFQTMIESVLSGRSVPAEAVGTAAQE
ncbi:MAG TPA: extracellular solute-binding protein, partial [Candidatus Paceibacterota bacterium]|nr:extracellular solute-binding protein [Candidatus Paceibacterota bacterium]